MHIASQQKQIIDEYEHAATFIKVIQIKNNVIRKTPSLIYSHHGNFVLKSMQLRKKYIPGFFHRKIK